VTGDNMGMLATSVPLPSRSSSGGRSATWRRRGSSSSPGEPAAPSSRRTRRPRCGRARSGRTRS
jgi:hypothetical protein